MFDMNRSLPFVRGSSEPRQINPTRLVRVHSEAVGSLGRVPVQGLGRPIRDFVSFVPVSSASSIPALVDDPVPKAAPHTSPGRPRSPHVAQSKRKTRPSLVPLPTQQLVSSTPRISPDSRAPHSPPPCTMSTGYSSRRSVSSPAPSNSTSPRLRQNSRPLPLTVAMPAPPSFYPEAFEHGYSASPSRPPSPGFWRTSVADVHTVLYAGRGKDREEICELIRDAYDGSASELVHSLRGAVS